MQLWPVEDLHRLQALLGDEVSFSAISATCKAFGRRLGMPGSWMRRGEEEPAELPEFRGMMEDLDALIEEATVSQGDYRPTFESGSARLEELAVELRTEVRYVHAPDWQMSGGCLVSKKGSWLKRSTQFSWELHTGEKLYCPEGILLPTLQVARVTDPIERVRHNWSLQHLTVWLKPALVASIEERQNVWYVYMPHWQVVDDGEGGRDAVVTNSVDSWLKRSCGLSGELEPFELVYVPRCSSLRLVCLPEKVTEPWELKRHQHVQQHRKVRLAAVPVTMVRERIDILVGQKGDMLESLAPASTNIKERLTGPV